MSAYHETHGTFQQHSYSTGDSEFSPETVSGSGIESNMSHPHTGPPPANRNDRRLSWVLGSAAHPGLSGVSPALASNASNTLGWSGTGGVGLARDLSRVEEEDEDLSKEDEDVTLMLSNVIALPRAMDTVAEEEEEEEEEQAEAEEDEAELGVAPAPTTPCKPTPPKRRPHSLIFGSRSLSTTPAGSPSFGFGGRAYPSPSATMRPLRALSLSAGHSHPTVSMPKLKPLALTSPNTADSGPTFGAPSSSSSASFIGHHLGGGSMTSSSVTSSPPVSVMKFERVLPTISAIAGVEHQHSGSSSTTRSSLSGSTSSASKQRSRRSISYSKSPSPERPQPVPAPTRRHVSLAHSPTASTSSGLSKTSSQAERDHAHDTWKKSLVRSLQRHSPRNSTSHAIESFGDLVMDSTPLDDDRHQSETETEDEDDIGRAVLKTELLKAREETGRVRTESEHVRAELDQLQKRLATGSGSDEVAEMKKIIEELEAEKTELLEDVTGFKLRLKFLEGQMIQEKAKHAGYARDLEEKDRMIGELLKKRRGRSGRSSSSGGDEGMGVGGGAIDEEEELKVAQVKLINEMRDQIFALASALEKERSEHVATKDALEVVCCFIFFCFWCLSTMPS